MFDSGSFIVTIGNYGAIVALYTSNSKEAKSKIFLDELNNEAKQDLLKVFSKNKKAKIYLLLDTVDQIYKKRLYPAIKKKDVETIIKRDLESDGDKNGLKNYILANKTKNSKINDKWECLLVSSSISETLSDWLEFLSDLPNRIVGIHMLPIESFSFFRLLKNNIDKQSKVAIRSKNLYCIIVQNKVSGIRQIVFSEDVIVFTRVVTYDFAEDSFLEKYEHDLYGTFEYLKRLFPEISANELNIINIFPERILTKISNIPNQDLNFINYTPSQAAKIAGLSSIASENSSYCDLIISKIFFDTRKKILKFTTPKISITERFFYIAKALRYFSAFLFILICIIFINISLSRGKTADLVEKAKSNKMLATEKLNKIMAIESEEKELSQNLDSNQIDKMVDIGKYHEYLNTLKPDISDIYNKLSIIKNYNSIATSFQYNLIGFNNEAENRNLNSAIAITGKLHNASGDLENLFVDFDGLMSAVKKTFISDDVTYDELPRNVDFTKKYYDTDVSINITIKPKIESIN